MKLPPSAEIFGKAFIRGYTDYIMPHWRRWHISLGIFFRDYVYFGQCDVQELAPKAAKD